jgi:hypothetical protein
VSNERVGALGIKGKNKETEGRRAFHCELAEKYQLNLLGQEAEGGKTMARILIVTEEPEEAED